MISILAQLVPSDPGLPEMPTQPSLPDLNDSVACFFDLLITSPVKFINWIGNGIVDVIALVMPSTPEEYQLGYLLNQIATEHPLVWALSGEIFSYAAPMLLILAGVKAWKIYRPF